jgi:hypothetical protein
MTPRVWTCQRVSGGVKCSTVNPRIKKLCTGCGKPRPATKVASHKLVLGEMSYDKWVELFGEKCGICGRSPSARRRLDRDHDHKSGNARGLLCARCNRALPSWVTVEWLLAAAAYLRKTLPAKESSE